MTNSTAQNSAPKQAVSSSFSMPDPAPVVIAYDSRNGEIVVTPFKVNKQRLIAPLRDFGAKPGIRIGGDTASTQTIMLNVPLTTGYNIQEVALRLADYYAEALSLDCRVVNVEIPQSQTKETKKRFNLQGNTRVKDAIQQFEQDRQNKGMK